MFGWLLGCSGMFLGGKVFWIVTVFGWLLGCSGMFLGV